MKISETIERECCEAQDLLPYRGMIAKRFSQHSENLSFCKHCGELWYSIPGKAWRRLFERCPACKEESCQ